MSTSTDNELFEAAHAPEKPCHSDIKVSRPSCLVEFINLGAWRQRCQRPGEKVSTKPLKQEENLSDSLQWHEEEIAEIRCGRQTIHDPRAEKDAPWITQKH